MFRWEKMMDWERAQCRYVSAEAKKLTVRGGCRHPEKKIARETESVDCDYGSYNGIQCRLVCLECKSPMTMWKNPHAGSPGDTWFKMPTLNEDAIRALEPLRKIRADKAEVLRARIREDQKALRELTKRKRTR